MTGTSSRSANASPARNILRTLWIIAAIYLALLIGQPAGLDPVKIVSDIRLTPALLLQQLLTGLADGAIIVIIALGYTLVYGIIELVNFAHGDVFMLGTYVALLSTSFFIVQVNNESRAPFWVALLAFIPAMLTMGGLNALIERVAYRRLRNVTHRAAPWPRVVAAPRRRGRVAESCAQHASITARRGCSSAGHGAAKGSRACCSAVTI